MVCPNCGGKLCVEDTRNNVDKNAIYRKKLCLKCGTILFTSETIAAVDLEYCLEWQKYSRGNIQRRGCKNGLGA